jgi:MFS family permease
MRPVFRLALMLLLLQSGFQGFTASLPVALTRAGVSDPAIGLVVGAAALMQLPAAFLVGALLDRLGGLRILYASGAAYIAGSAVLILPGVDPAGSMVPFIVARLLQGLGLAGTLPAALSLVPRLVPPNRRSVGLAFINSAQNLTMVALPPISLIVLGIYTLSGVAVGAIGLTLLGMVVGLGLWQMVPARDVLSVTASPTSHGTASRKLGLAFRKTWVGPLLIVLLYMIHWGVISAYLPPRAERAGANVGLFFAVDALAVLLTRIPVGWLTDRMARHWLVIGGLAATTGAIIIVLLSATMYALVVAGFLTGLGAGCALTPNLVELSERSGDADRGSAFAMFSAVLAGGLLLGSIASAPIVGLWGFSGAAILALVGLVASAILVLRGRATAARHRRAPLGA